MAIFRKRMLTAFIFAVIMLIGLVWNQWTSFLLFTIIHFGCWVEYQRIVALIYPEYAEITPFHRYGVMLAGWCMMLYFTNDMFNIGDFSLHSIGWWLGLMFIFLLPLVELLLAKQMSFKNIWWSFCGLIYISLSWALMIGLFEYRVTNAGEMSGPNIPLALLFAIWINDTMAYIVGSMIGKTPFSKVSPNKTLEGTFGGIIVSTLIIGLIGNSPASWLIGIHPDENINQHIGYFHWPIFAALATIAGTFGDLFESRLKRMAGLKDSGQIMPGHGGFLDRFDSLLFAVPVIWIYMWFIH